MTTRGASGDRATGPADITEQVRTPGTTPEDPTTGTTTGRESEITAGAGTVPGTVETTPGTVVRERYEGDGDSVSSLRAEIEHTRHELGETVAALAAKTDVKSRAKGTARGVMSSAASQAQHLLHPMEEKAKRTGRLMKGKAVETAESEQARTTARRGGLIALAAVGLLALELLRRRRNARMTGWQRMTRSSRWPGMTTRRMMTRRTGGMLSRTSHGPLVFGGTRRVAPGLHVRGPRSGMRSGMRGMGMGSRGPSMFGGTRRVAPGLHVRSPRTGMRGIGSGPFGLPTHRRSTLSRIAHGLGFGTRPGFRFSVRRAGPFAPSPGIHVRNRRSWGWLP